MAKNLENAEPAEDEADDGLTPFERFEKLARFLFNTPKATNQKAKDKRA